MLRASWQCANIFADLRYIRVFYPFGMVWDPLIVKTVSMLHINFSIEDDVKCYKLTSSSKYSETTRSLAKGLGYHIE